MEHHRKLHIDRRENQYVDDLMNANTQENDRPSFHFQTLYYLHDDMTVRKHIPMDQ